MLEDFRRFRRCFPAFFLMPTIRQHSPASVHHRLERARYLATSLLLADNNDMVRMIVNSVKTDMASGNEAGAVLQKKHVNNCFLRA